MKTKMNQEQLNKAYAMELLTFAQVGEGGGNIISAAGAMLYMLIELRQNPQGEWADRYAERIAEHLKFMISKEGHAPGFSLGPVWSYCTLTAAISVAKHTPGVWNMLSATEKEIYDFIMKCFAYIMAFGTADENDYKTGPDMRGNFNKIWNPNFRLAVVPPMLFVREYFGTAEKVDEILAAFSYDETIKKFEQYGFGKALLEWTVEPPTLPNGQKAPGPKTFLEEGGPAYLIDRHDDVCKRLHIYDGKEAGTGKGVRVQYTYQGHTLDEQAAIVNKLFYYNYSGGKVVSCYGIYEDGSPKAYIADHTVSPYEGQEGMMLEFASFDEDGIRSSTSYCTHDFELVCPILAALKELGVYDIKAKDNTELFALMWVGNMDLLYKNEHGYQSFSLGSPKGFKQPEEVGYTVWKAWWLDNYSESNC